MGKRQYNLVFNFLLKFFLFYFFKEIVLSEEQKNPDLLKNFDKIFEIELPLEFATMDWKSQVYTLLSFSSFLSIFFIHFPMFSIL